MSAYKKIPFFLPLLALFFCLHGSAENFGSLTVKEVVLTGISVLLGMLFFFAVCLLFTRNMRFAALVAFFISCCFFFFGAIHDAVKAMGFLKFLQSYTVFLPLLLVLTVLWITYLKKRKEHWQKFTLYLNLLLLVYCVMDAVRIGYKAITARSSNVHVAFNFSAVKYKPDVYFLLFDEYPGLKSLEDSFHFSNKALYDHLQADSFQVLPISANYNVTQFSMASILNMGYIPQHYDSNAVSQADIQSRQNEINDGEVFTIFEKMGYQIENNSIFDVKNKPGIYDANGFILGHNRLLTDKIFLNRMNRDIGGRLPSWLIRNIPFVKDQSNDAHKNDNALLAQRTVQLSERKKTAPFFCYSHFILPHGPYLFDSLGKATDPKINSAPLARMKRSNFISYLKYTNDFAKKLIAGIRKNDPSALIIFMSDHGFREYLPDNSVQVAHFDNMALIRFPEANSSIPDTLTNVNLFRYVFNTQFGQKLVFLPDAKYALKLQ